MDGDTYRTFWGLKKGVQYLLGFLAAKGPQQELLWYLFGYWAEKSQCQFMCCFRTGAS